MYCFNKTILQPTSIEHCVSCNFISEEEKHLIVAGANRLRFFRICSQSNPKTRLEEIFDCSLFGNIESIVPVRISQRSNKLDCLLLAFLDAKLSIIEWDPWHHDIRTVSLHQFEEDELKESFRNVLYRPQLRVDPLNRCGIMLFYGKHLAVLPIVSDDVNVDKLVSDCETVPLSLHSYVVNLKEIDESLCNILDFQFLYGYSDPTLVLLYAPINTWIGILNSRRDNVKLLAISINLNDQSHPAIWSVPSLPCDTFGLMSIPRPIGGILVFGANCVLHLNQGIPAYGISLNSFTESNTDFPLEITEDLVISLDCSRFTFISDVGDTIALSTKDGDIYIIFLITDDMRKMKKIHFEKAASSVICTSICKVESNFLFLGSRLGNSLLLKYSPQSSSLIQSHGKYDTYDHKHYDQLPNSTINQTNQIKQAKDDIDLEMYGSSIIPENEITFRVGSYSFEVCDSLINISPIASMTIGQALNISEEFSDNIDPDLEIIGCIGHSKNGSLVILQRSLRPQLVTTSELVDSHDMWTLKTVGDEYHRFLLISQNESTMILQTGLKILELDQDQTGFCTNEKTIYAGSVNSNLLFIQVCSESLRLLENIKCLQLISMREFDSHVVACSICDPYGVLLLENNKLLFLEINFDKSLTISNIPMHTSATIITFSLYRDYANTFKIQPLIEPLPVPSNGSLTGNSNLPPQLGHLSNTTEHFWLALVRNSGVLEIYSVPEFQLVFMVRNFSFAPLFLIDSGHIESDSGTAENISESRADVQEILFTSLDINGKLPFILAIINNDLVIYKAFEIGYSSHEGHLLFRFKRDCISILMEDRKHLNVEECDTVQYDSFNSFSMKFVPPRFRQFENIGNYTGIFICGPYPHWIFKNSKGSYNIHPMYIDGPVESFSSFHNENCRFGFIFYNREGALRIALLPNFLNLDFPWPLRKVPLRCTAHFVAYHIESKTYALALSNKMKGNILIKSTGDDTEEFETVSKGPRFIYPYQEKYFVELFSPTNWEVVPNTRFELYPFEHVTALKALHLRSQERASGLKVFICVGTTVLYGEDFTAKGRILIFDIIDVVPEPGKPLTRNRLKLLYDKEQVGPISALDQVNGLLFTCIGKKIFMWNFKDTKELIGVAFIDAELYIHSAISLKNFILVADITKSIQLLQYREDQKSLSLISKDPYPLRSYSIEYLIDGNQLGFIVSDASKNLHLFLYQPEDPESIGGLRLIRQGIIHIGSHINAMFRIRCKPFVQSGSNIHHVRGMAINEKRHVTFYATLDGSIGFIVAISEKTFRRLQSLQNKLGQCLQHHAGLNPKSFRLAHMYNKSTSTSYKNILDGDLLWRYTFLGFKERNELAKQIGTSSSQILDDLRSIEKITNFF